MLTVSVHLRRETESSSEVWKGREEPGYWKKHKHKQRPWAAQGHNPCPALVHSKHWFHLRPHWQSWYGTQKYVASQPSIDSFVKPKNHRVKVFSSVGRLGFKRPGMGYAEAVYSRMHVCFTWATDSKHVSWPGLKNVWELKPRCPPPSHQGILQIQRKTLELSHQLKPD